MSTVDANMLETKSHLKSIFLNYCDFNKRSGEPFISQTALQRLFKDAKIVGKDSNIQMNDVSIMIQAALSKKINLIKSITFP